MLFIRITIPINYNKITITPVLMYAFHIKLVDCSVVSFSYIVGSHKQFDAFFTPKLRT